MRKQYHILNGDALKKQFPEHLSGEIIVARECLVEGDVKGNSLDEFFQIRADFISRNYNGYTSQEYYKETVPEFQKILKIPNDADINLWFEDDLFCQVNFWFVVHLIYTSKLDNSCFLIRPPKQNQYGFGELDQQELFTIYKTRLKLINLEKLANLWKFYQNDDLKNLELNAKELHDKYPFLLPAVKAHIERIPTKDTQGRPVQTLIQIIKDLNTKEFGPVFKEFCKRESIYGFGDVQVKSLLDKIKD